MDGFAPVGSFMDFNNLIDSSTNVEIIVDMKEGLHNNMFEDTILAFDHLQLGLLEQVLVGAFNMFTAIHYLLSTFVYAPIVLLSSS